VFWEEMACFMEYDHRQTAQVYSNIGFYILGKEKNSTMALPRIATRPRGQPLQHHSRKGASDEWVLCYY
jgi:hypothetical protein